MKSFVKTILNRLLPKNIAVVSAMNHLGRNRKINIPRANDFIRVSSLELITIEIYENNIQGSVAELVLC